MSFGLDTPGRSKFDDLMPQASFDAMPLPVHGEDNQSPFKGMIAQSALEFASKFNLSRSYSVEEGGSDVHGGTQMGHPSSVHRTYAIPSPYSRERRSEHATRPGSDRRMPPMNSYHPEFMSPQPPPSFQKNIHPSIPLPRFPPSKGIQQSPDCGDSLEYRHPPRQMHSHLHHIPPSMDRGSRKSNTTGDREMFSPGPFRVKVSRTLISSFTWCVRSH